MDTVPQDQQPKITPQQPTHGTISIGGNNIVINQDSVTSTASTSTSVEFIKKLENAADTGVFSPSEGPDEQSDD